MSKRSVRRLWGLGVLGAALLILQAGFLPSTDEMLRGTKSEIRNSAMPRFYLDAPATRPSEIVAQATDVVAHGSTPALAQTPNVPTLAQAPQPAALTAPDPRRDALRRLFALLIGRPLSGSNRATNAVTFDEHPPYAITAEDFGINCVMNDPVFPMTGEMTYTHPVLRVPGVGLDFAFVLNYRSGFSYDGPVGKRWEHNWNARIKVGGGSLTRYANNRADVYPGTTSYTSPAGFFEKSMTRIGTGDGATVERRLRDGTLETYTQLDSTNETDWYFLTSVTHRDADNTITLHYDGVERLTKVTDTRGKDFKFAYDGNNRLTKVADWSSGSEDRAWTLAYAGDGDAELASVQAPGVSPTTFTYWAGTLLKQVTAPSAGSPYLSMEYDNHSRVTLQQFGASGQNYTLAYDTKVMTETDREGADRIYLWNDSGEITKIRQERTSGVFDDTIVVWDGALVTKITNPEGNGQIFQYTNGYVTAAIQSTAGGLSETSIGAMRAGSDHLVTEYAYESDTNWDLVTKIIDPEGNDWLLGRDGLGNVTSYTTPEHNSDPYVLGYDGRSRITSIEDPEGRTRSFAYGASGTLTKIAVDPGGLNLQTTLTRDVFENVVTVADPEGRLTELDRNIRGYVTKVTTPEGHETDYFYDGGDLITEVRRDNGHGDAANARHRVLYEYNILDLVTKVREYYGGSWASNRVWEYVRDKEDRVTLVKQPEANRDLKTIYDMRGLETTRTIAYGQGEATTVVMAYDKNQRLTLTKDGLGNETTQEFDAFNRAIKTTDGEGHYSTVTFDKNGNATTMAAKDSGNTQLTQTLLVFDLNNRLTKTRRWASYLGGSSYVDATLVYDKAGNLIEKQDPCGCGGSTSTTFAFDAAGRMTLVTDAAGNTVTYDRDKAGLLTKVTRDETEGGATETYVSVFEFDKDGHLTKSHDKGGGADTPLTTTLVVDAFGRVSKTTDPNGNHVFYRRDDFGRVTKVQRQMTATPTYIETLTGYDLNDNVVSETSVRPGDDATTTYVYDKADRMITMTDESGTHVQRLTYDAAGNVSLAIDGNGSVSAYVYDQRNLATRIDHTLAEDVVGPTMVKFSYDGLGRVTAAVNRRVPDAHGSYDSRVERDYNTLSGITQERTWVNPSNETATGEFDYPAIMNYTFDATGHVTEIAYPLDVVKVKHHFDALNRITKIEKYEDGDSTPDWPDVSTWTFEGPSRMKTLEWGNGTKELMLYDEYGRATEMVHDRPTTGGRKTMYAYKRGYDAGGRPIFERRDYWSSNSASPSLLNGPKDFGDLYRYDAANRLTKVVRGVGYHAGASGHDDVETAAETTLDFVTRAQYTLDDGGNRPELLLYDSNGSASKAAWREDHEFNIENELTRREFFEYDGSGANPTSAGEIEYEYDQNGTVVADSFAKVDIHNRLYSVGTWVYRYDPFGRRVEKRDTAGAYWRLCFYDGVTCVAEFQYGEEIWLVWARVFGPYLVDQLLWVKFDWCGLCYMRGFIHLDFLGSVVMGTGADDTLTGEYEILEQYRYGEYGNVTFCSGNGVPLNPNVSQGDQAYTYTGRQWDVELGVYYYRARYYAADAGVFLARDPVSADALSNSYAYVDALPTLLTDPFGLQPHSAETSRRLQRAVHQSIANRLLAAVRKRLQEKPKPPTAPTPPGPSGAAETAASVDVIASPLSFPTVAECNTGTGAASLAYWLLMWMARHQREHPNSIVSICLFARSVFHEAAHLASPGMSEGGVAHAARDLLLFFFPECFANADVTDNVQWLDGNWGFEHALMLQGSSVPWDERIREAIRRVDESKRADDASRVETKDGILMHNVAVTRHCVGRRGMMTVDDRSSIAPKSNAWLIPVASNLFVAEGFRK